MRPLIQIYTEAIEFQTLSENENESDCGNGIAGCDVVGIDYGCRCDDYGDVGNVSETGYDDLVEEMTNAFVINGHEKRKNSEKHSCSFTHLFLGLSFSSFSFCVGEGWRVSSFVCSVVPSIAFSASFTVGPSSCLASTGSSSSLNKLRVLACKYLKESVERIETKAYKYV